MARWDDDDDWVGTPPEGRHSHERSDPAFWRRQHPPAIVAGLIGLAVLVVVVIVLVA